MYSTVVQELSGTLHEPLSLSSISNERPPVSVLLRTLELHQFNSALCAW
jgi:hypothetical protein